MKSCDNRHAVTTNDRGGFVKNDNYASVQGTIDLNTSKSNTYTSNDIKIEYIKLL